jgi:hypothetical protein
MTINIHNVKENNLKSILLYFIINKIIFNKIVNLYFKQDVIFFNDILSSESFEILYLY